MAYYTSTPFPDAEEVAMDILDDIAGTYVVAPTDITEPFILVQRTGGSDDGITDFPRVTVDCIAFTRRDAWRMAEDVRQTILSSPRQKFGTATVDQSATETPPQEIPEENTDIRRVVATYRLAMRRPVTV